MISEFEIIKKLRKTFPRIGNDAESFKIDNGIIPVASVDSFFDGVHFNLSYFTYYDVGYKSAASSISDIAAVGGKPLYLLISLALKEENLEGIDELYRGIQDIAKEYNIEVIGGDITKASNFGIFVGVIGETAKPVKRTGAKLGDIICVTGKLGGSYGGLVGLKNGIRNDKLLEKHLRPKARVEEGLYLQKFASSMIDISDGLIIDLSHILEESNVGAKLWTDKIPIDKEAEKVAAMLGDSPKDYGMYGGEDFELLFTINPKVLSEINGKINYYEIGEIIPKGLTDENGKAIPIKGYEHFSNNRKEFIVTIDGTAASGKSTTAREAAKRLRFKHIDTGAMYRAVAFLVNKKGINPSNVKEVEQIARNAKFEFRFANGKNRIFVNGKDLTTDIRDAQISKIASLVGTYKGVREILVAQQRALGKNTHAILEGRDTGTVVFRDADVKIYMDADINERARRRQKELEAKGVKKELADIVIALKTRDAQNSKREHSPLKIPDGAIIIDTTELTIEEEIDKVVEIIKSRL